MATCRSCGAKIDWIKTKAGKNMPVEGEPVEYADCEDGDVIVTDGGETYKVDHSKPLVFSVSGRISHFSTCPDADKWRNK